MLRRSSQEPPEEAARSEEEGQAGEHPNRLRYPHPRVVLLDLPPDTADILRDASFNVSEGSFGAPYKVERSSHMVQVVQNSHFQFDFMEQDIVVVNLAPPDTTEPPRNEEFRPESEKSWWASCSTGIIDPRPITMKLFAPILERIYDQGGVFIVFARGRSNSDYVFGHVEYREVIPDAHPHVDNWSFLSELAPSSLEVADDLGHQIGVTGSQSALSRLLSHHVSGAKFWCTFKPGPGIADRWVTLATNKYGDLVAGAILMPIDATDPGAGIKSMILLLPDLADKGHLLRGLLTDVLPGLVPRQFPHVDRPLWLRNPEYELPQIRDLQARITAIEDEAARRTAALYEEIDTAREQTQYLADLVTATGDSLVDAVETTLRVLGFRDVVNVDRDNAAAGEPSKKDEDLQIRDGPPLLLVEVKGITFDPTDDDCLQVAKYLAPRMKELGRTDIQGLSLINHQRALPGLDRNPEPFRDVVIDSAEQYDVGLMTTWDLYRLARSYVINGWNHEHMRDLFYQRGRIRIMPSHYEPLGVVERFSERAQAVGIKIANGEVRLGDRIAFELPVQFSEQCVESLQVDTQPVDRAEAGTLVGIATRFTKAELTRGTCVYRIVDDQPDHGERPSSSASSQS